MSTLLNPRLHSGLRPTLTELVRVGRGAAGVLRCVGTGLLDLVLPWRCLACESGEGPAALPGLCAACAGLLPWRVPGPSPLEVGDDAFAELFVALRYMAPVDELILALKYGGDRAVAVALAALLHRALRQRPLATPVELLVPVPMHPLKRWVRGIDHTRELTDELGRYLRLPTRAAVRRRRWSRAQGGARSLDERVRQVAGAFVASARAIRGRRVGLVDDVVTSGATATECARALLAAGARSVTLLAVAGNG